MYITEVKLKNFRGYGENPKDEEGFYKFSNLDKDIVILSGFNGFGKTSFVEAIEWCLTDNIQRLRQIEKEVYDVRELRKSHYLKFYKPEHQQQTNRQIVVELSFSNGLKIQRTSFSNHPRTSTDKDTYDSKLKIYMNDEVVSNNSEEQLLSYFAKDASSTEFLNTHILGQENMNSFIRSNNPGERRSRFLQLLNLNQLDDIFQQTNKIKNKSFATKKKEINDQINSLTKKLDGINNFLSVLNFGDMQQYIDAVNAENLKLQLVLKDSSDDTQLNLSIFRDIKTDTCVQFLIKVEQTKNQLVTEKVSLEKKLEEALLLKSIIEKIIILSRGLNLIQKTEQAEVLKQTDYVHLMTEKNSIFTHLEKSLIIEAQLKQKNTLLNEFENLFEVLGSLKPDGESIDVSFWEQLTEQGIKYANFVNSYKIDGFDINSELINNQLSELIKLKGIYDKYALDLTTIRKNLRRKQDELSSLSKINSSYVKVLDNVREYLAANPDVKHCPVCLNANFSDGYYSKVLEKEGLSASVVDKLLAIINHTVAAGNGKVREVSSEVSAIKIEEMEVLKKIREEVILNILETHRILITLFRKQYKSVNVYYLNLETNIRKDIDTHQLRLNNLVDKQLRYEECLKYVFEERIIDQGTISIADATLEKVNDILTNLNNQLEEWNSEVIEKQIFSYKPSKIEISNNIEILEKKEGLSKYYPHNENQLSMIITALQHNINYCILLSNAINAVLVYKIPEDYLDKFADFTKLEGRIHELKLELNKVDQYEVAVKRLNANVSSEQQSIIETKLKKHPIIRYIYEAINPHPFYKELIISSDKNGANFKNGNEEIHLDLLFSSAQLNILALSVFLGLGLTQNQSRLNQLLLDDPIQSMDDVNILAFIDILRGILDMKTRDKKILLSTHDSNFAQLLTIKLRNKEYVHYKFTGYGDEGPIINLLKNNPSQV
jgi:hypothetical protein